VEIVAKDQLGDLVADGFDAAVRFGHPEASTLMARKLLDMRVVTCAAPAYLARRGTPAHPRDLEKHRHECLLFRDPATRLPFTWEFHRKGKILPVNVRGQLIVNDGQTLIAACLTGTGIAQMFDWGLADHFSSRRLVNLFPAWTEERWPLYAYHLFRHHSPAKIKAFMNFIVGLIGGVKSTP
jgi:DNA-binding transcriptional LysR family regulator